MADIERFVTFGRGSPGRIVVRVGIVYPAGFVGVGINLLAGVLSGQGPCTGRQNEAEQQFRKPHDPHRHRR